MQLTELYNIFLQHPIITTDSRDVPEGSIFFALKGETFNGNAYAKSSLDKGAALAVVDDEQYYEAGNPHMMKVDDVLTTLQCLANHHRRQLGTTIIGVTGTNGKTTTKELIATALKKKYNTLYTQGNLNNHIGVPKTLLQLTTHHEMAVIEMGANHPGEIKTLVNIVEPDYGIITNVGKAHLQGFGSLEGVIRTKGELYDYLRQHNGTAFINNDNPHLMQISHGLKLIKYGQSEADNLLVKGKLLECNPLLKLRWSGGDIQTHLIGSYNLDNILAAACIATHLGVPANDISQALAEYIPTNNRSQLTQTADNRLVVDAYNANPTSMRAALDNFRLIHAAHKMCILGDMKELGSASGEEHQAIVNILVQSDIEQVWLVGEEFAKTNHPETYRTFPNVEVVKAEIAKHKPTGHTILIKGSNSTHLIQIVEHL